VPISSVADVEQALAGQDYLADPGLATAVFLARSLETPLLLEGEAGVGKTEVAKALAGALGARLIRLQCHEGIDLHHAVYDWDYARQLLAIRAAEAGGGDPAADLFGERFLLRRPLLEALESDEDAVLLIDEVDRADDEFEAFLLEFLSEFQVSIPELGTVRARRRPVVVLTSNRTRELHDALKRRCLYHWIDYPTRAREAEIVRARLPGSRRRSWGGSATPSRGCGGGALQAARRGGDDHLGARAAGAGRRRVARGHARGGAQGPRGRRPRSRDGGPRWGLRRRSSSRSARWRSGCAPPARGLAWARS
jgi:MoxR-like ATPase